MWSLQEFQHDDGIPGDQVYVRDDDLGELGLVDTQDALARAHEAGLHLLAVWPADGGAGPRVCQIGALALPPRWEQVAAPDAAGSDDGQAPAFDEELWFDAECGGRDVVLGNAHTFTGRISAWCPGRRRAYNVSLGEMGRMSAATRYWVQGFLHGSEPRWPVDPASGDPAEEELPAWRAATARYRRTGSWYGRWHTCSSCGAVLLPDTAAERCEHHDHREA